MSNVRGYEVGEASGQVVRVVINCDATVLSLFHLRVAADRVMEDDRHTQVLDLVSYAIRRSLSLYD